MKATSHGTDLAGTRVLKALAHGCMLWSVLEVGMSASTIGVTLYNDDPHEWFQVVSRPLQHCLDLQTEMRHFKRLGHDHVCEHECNQRDAILLAFDHGMGLSDLNDKLVY